MLVKLDDPTALSKAIDIISELVIEVRIKINEFGLSVAAIDPANVAMVGYKLPRSAFSQFETGEEVLGVNLTDLKRILKRCGAKSSLVLKKEGNTLKIEIADRIKRNFSLTLIEVDSEDKEMPNLEYTSKVTLQSADFISSIEDCIVVAEACTFVVDDGKFIIESKGLNSARSEFSSQEAEIVAENCRSRYSLEYLQKFIKGAKLADKTLLNFADDHPLKIEFKTGHFELSFILAPRVETDD